MNKQTRKKFLDTLLGGGLIAWLGAIIYPVSRYLVPPRTPDINPDSLDVGKVSDFQTNSAKIVRFGRKPAIVVRDKNDTFHALTAVCTHLDCTVQYKSDTEQIWCACHNGIYDLQGNNISGPPPRPLTQFKINFKNGKIFISRENMA